MHWCINDAPKLEKHVLQCIETGCEVDLDIVPAWLQRLVVGSITNPILLRYLRQLLLFSYKAHVQHDKATTEASFNQFAQTNDEVGRFANSFSQRSPSLLDLARRHTQSVLYAFQEKEIIPFHGPGASTTPKGYSWSKWYTQIEALYPYSDACFKD